MISLRERQPVAAFALLILVAILALSGCKRPSTSGISPSGLAAEVLDARVKAVKQNSSDPPFEEVERRLADLYGNSSGQADEAIVILMSFYLGEHNGEELYENLLSRGPRMIPVIERYLREQPALMTHYPKETLLERDTTVMFLKEALEILKVQAGARHVSNTEVETAPLRQQTGPCKLTLMHRPQVKFPDDLIQTGEAYRNTPVLRVDIEEDGAITNAQLVQASGIKHLDALLLQNVSQWNYAPRPGCGVVQSNIAITVDWMAAQ
jgi:TonB family protein